MLAGKDFPSKLLWRTLTKIRRERRRTRQQKAAWQRDNRLAQLRQRRQHSDHKHVQRQRQNTTITLQVESMKRGNTDCRRFKKRWDQGALVFYIKIYLLRCNDRQQQLHDLYNARTSRISFQRIEDSLSAFTVSFILQWTVYNTDNVWHCVGKRYEVLTEQNFWFKCSIHLLPQTIPSKNIFYV